MLKANKILSAALICSSVIAISTMTGCRSTSIPVEVEVPGEFNLSGISKIAIVDFNSVKGDSVAGVFSADKETTSIVQRMIATTFCKGKMYQIANLDIEKAIADKHTMAKVANKFDAIMYGRVWWQISPEYRVAYPKKFTLERWKNVKYDTGAKDPVKKKPIYSVAKVTQRKTDVLETLYYRSLNANLMLSITLYKFNKDSELDIEKVTETYAVASQNFTIDNGDFATFFDQIGADKANRADRLKASTEKKSFFGSLFEKKKKDVSGKVVVTQKTATIPTVLQAKLMLAGKLSSQLAKKLTPSKITFNVPCDFEDNKLFNLLKDGAFKGTIAYSTFKLPSELNEMISEFFYFVKKETKEAKEETKNSSNKNKAKESPEKKIAKKLQSWENNDKIRKSVEDYKEYIYAIAISNEALGNYEEAHATYSFLFNIIPERETALGISRCAFALNMKDQVKEKKEAKEEAKKAASEN